MNTNKTINIAISFALIIIGLYAYTAFSLFTL